MDRSASAQQSAKGLFKYVAGVLNGAFPTSVVGNHSIYVKHWDTQISAADVSFEAACDALAAAIQDNHVPQQGIDVLKGLVENPNPKAGNLVVSDRLKEVLLPSDESVADYLGDIEENDVEEPSNTKLRLRLSDCADLDSLESCFPLQDLLMGTDYSNIDFIFNETGVVLTLEDDDGQLAFTLASQDAKPLKSHAVDRAFELANDLIHDATTRLHDEWLEKQHAEQLRLESEAIEAEEKERQRLEEEERDDERKAAEAREKQRKEIEAKKPMQTNVNKLYRFVSALLANQNLPDEAWTSIAEIITSTDDSEDVENVFSVASRLLSRSLTAGEIPKKGVDNLVELRDAMIEKGAQELYEALDSVMCPVCFMKRPRAAKCDTCKDTRKSPCVRCAGSGRFRPQCNGCKGSGKGKTKMYCPTCNGTGKKDLGECNACMGKKVAPCIHCSADPRVGPPRTLCLDCVIDSDVKVKMQATQGGKGGKGKGKDLTPPPPGMTIEKCSAGDLTRLKQLWQMRGADGSVEAAWKVDNPLRTYAFTKRRAQLREELGNKEPDGLEGFHGTHPDAVISICDTGFDKSRRSGQVYGAGEYFAKNPNVSVGYCRGGSYMLVCRLTLGFPSSTPENKDGDHIWVPSMGYYVIKEPDQVLPQFIIRYSQSHHHMYNSLVQSAKLESVLSQDKWTTKAKEEIKPVPSQRPCNMKRDFARVLWMGFLHAHISDDKLEADIRRFLNKYAKDYTAGMKIQIVKGHFKKAHAILETPIPRDLVHALNKEVFTEDGNNRTICVEDAHGSPGQQCPRFIAGYCRGRNLRFTHPCWCDHPAEPTAAARFQRTHVDLHGAKATELMDRFYASAPFHNGHPKVIAIRQITNETLSRCHEEYRRYLCTKHMEEPAVQELYHGTNNNILDILYQHGLQPPSDTNPSDRCPVSGGKGLCTSLCNNNCKYCTEPHEWNKCHMYGLGIYLADMAQKSHRYCSQPQSGKNGRPVYRMVVCSVLGKSFQVEGHLKTASAMHDVVNVRALDEELMDEMIEPCHTVSTSSGIGATIEGTHGETWGRVVADEGYCWKLHTGRIAKKDTEGWKWNWASTAEVAADNLESAEKSDLIFVKGLGGSARPGYSVVNSEYIAFHPHQCLPKYEIEYELS